MGTNYYVYDKPVCEYCGLGGEPRHIGKSSVGWCFSLRIYPEEGINNFDDWKEHLCGKRIEDEYEREVLFDDMIATITDRGRKPKWDAKPHFYNSWEEFHVKNNSVQGPNGLLRHRIGRFCVGHGEGTYDYMEREFS